MIWLRIYLLEIIQCQSMFGIDQEMRLPKQ